MFEEFSPNVSSTSERALPLDADLASAIQKLMAVLQKVAAGLGASVAPAALETNFCGRKAVRAKEAIPITGLGRSSFFAKQNPNDPAWDLTFPRSFKLGPSPNSPTVWFVDELEAWLESRAASRRH
jgi:prophage regulatory protein